MLPGASEGLGVDKDIGLLARRFHQGLGYRLGQQMVQASIPSSALPSWVTLNHLLRFSEPQGQLSL